MKRIIQSSKSVSRSRLKPQSSTTKGPSRNTRRHSSTSFKPSQPSPDSEPQSTTSHIDVEALLSKPTWSISTLLPPTNPSNTQQEQQIPSSKLHHLLRLSALEPPKSPEAEADMLSTLSSQLHFVRAVQAVDTSGVEPLRALRDETSRAEREREEDIMRSCEEALGKEQVVGKYHKRIRRRKDLRVEKDVECTVDWRPVDGASRKVGRFFVVDKGKKVDGDDGASKT